VSMAPDDAPLRFLGAVVLTRREVFDALEACATAERVLLRCGRPAEAACVAALFEVLEDRVSYESPASLPSSAPDPEAEGSNSSDRELTQ
jgi:hypothetical protein